MATNKITYLSAVHDTTFSKHTLFKPTIVVVMPAHNEEDDIKKALLSLSKQVFPPGLSMHVYIALDNCTDNTEKVIYETNKELGLTIFLLETVDNTERKVGSLNQVYRLFYGDETHLRRREVGPLQKEYVRSIQAFVGMDADVQLEKNTIATLWDELNSAPYVGSVSANFTCQFPTEGERDSRPGREIMRNWWISQQIRDFADWTLRQKQNRHIAEIAGGQCSIFRPEAMLEVREKYKLNGFFDNSTDTEDLLITQHLRACGWTCLTSKSARAYVDSMDNYPAYFAQRKKWVSGTIDYMLLARLSTSFSRKAWGQQLILLVNFLIRILLITLIPLSIWQGVFTWNWIWAIPFVVSSILNVSLTFLSPDYRAIDIILTALGVNQEVYLWITIHVHISSWLDKLKIEQQDGWANQYKAESGQGGSPINFIPIFLLGVLGYIFYKYRNQWMINEQLITLAKGYMTIGYPLLTFMTIIMSLSVIRKIFRLRYPYRP